MRVVVLGDTHGRTLWKEIIDKERPDKVIFIGDYFDTHDDISLEQQIANFKEIMRIKLAFGNKMVNLIGNHDLHYFPEVGENGTSGYQRSAAKEIGELLDKHKRDLQMCYQMDEFLFTHAGVSSVFMDEKFGPDGWTVEGIQPLLNELWIKNPKAFNFNGLYSNTGDEVMQTPVWIRPMSLLKANRETLREKVIQVVGHTTMHRIDIEGKATGGRYYFIDTLGTSGEYLIIEDEKVSCNTIKGVGNTSTDTDQ